MAKKVWLKCESDDGIFSDECDVSLTTPAGKKVVSTVSRDKVKIIKGSNALNVRIVKIKGKEMAVVPSTQPEVVSFRKGDLIAA